MCKELKTLIKIYKASDHSKTRKEKRSAKLIVLKKFCDEGKRRKEKEVEVNHESQFKSEMKPEIKPESDRKVEHASKETTSSSRSEKKSITAQKEKQIEKRVCPTASTMQAPPPYCLQVNRRGEIDPPPWPHGIGIYPVITGKFNVKIDKVT